jgi:hypothetical protein
MHTCCGPLKNASSCGCPGQLAAGWCHVKAGTGVQCCTVYSKRSCTKATLRAAVTPVAPCWASAGSCSRAVSAGCWLCAGMRCTAISAPCSRSAVPISLAAACCGCTTATAVPAAVTVPVLAAAKRCDGSCWCSCSSSCYAAATD